MPLERIYIPNLLCKLKESQLTVSISMRLAYQNCCGLPETRWTCRGCRKPERGPKKSEGSREDRVGRRRWGLHGHSCSETCDIFH